MEEERNEVQRRAKRPRKKCSKCGELLSNSAYHRHLSHAVCPGRANLVKKSLAATESRQYPDDYYSLDDDYDTQLITKDDGEFSDSFMEGAPSKILAQDTSSEIEAEMVSYPEENIVCIVPETSSASQSSESDVDIVMSDSEELHDFITDDCGDEQIVLPADSSDQIKQLTSVEEDNLKQENMNINKVVTHIALFLTFFQLCYKVSERGISLLLAFLKSLLSWIASISLQSSLKLLANNMPGNVYYLKKLIGNKSNILLYVSCPKRHSVSKLNECIRHRNGHSESLKCSYKEFPNHPHISRRQQCDTLLMRKVKQGSHYNLVPRKVYAYISLKDSISKLCSKPDFLKKCEHWRSRSVTPDFFTDVYDGAIWKSFQVVDGEAFLQVPNNLCFKLNLD